MRGLIVIALLGLASPAAAEPLPVRLKDGATWVLTIEKTRETEREGKTERSAVTFVSKLSWKKSSRGPDILTLTPVSTTPGEESPAELATVSQFEVPVVMEVDESLAPQRIVNIQELRKGFQALLSRIGPPAAEGVGKILDGLSDESITSMATLDLVRTTQVQGADMEVGEEVTYEEPLPNPLGGTPIRSIGAFRLESLDRKAGRAVVTWRQAYDPESATQSLAAVMESVGSNVAPEKLPEVRAFMSKMKLEREDRCRYELDTVFGLVTKAECSGQTVAGAEGQTARRTETWIMTQTLPEKR